MNDDRSMGLLAWQLSLYPFGHRDRRNLVLHAITVPLFMAGTVALLSGAVLSPWVAVGGALAMVIAVAAQGRGHRREGTAPVPFQHPFDAVARLVVEQWVTFPRFVLSGGFARAFSESTLRDRTSRGE